MKLIKFFRFWRKLTDGAKTDTRFFYKQRFYRQRQAEIGKTLSKS